MKKVSKGTFLFLILVSVSAVCAKHFWRGTTLSVDEAAKRWGTAEFNAQKFKTGDIKIRSSMAASLLKHSKEFQGKSVLQIREMLGATDGFYFSEAYPTYLIQIGENHDQETWQLVFLIDKDRKIDSIIVHKNCCD